MAVKVLVGAISVYVLLIFFICCLKYYSFMYSDFDLAVHDQILWNLLNGRIFNSILGIDFLGNHVHFISFLVAPIYGLFPHPLFLILLQTVFLAGGAVPLYALARRYLGPQLSLAVCLTYLSFPGLEYTNLFEFHPTCFAVFFLLSAALYFYSENFFWFNVYMVLSLLCQENMALIFVMWGIYALILKRPLKWVLSPFFSGLFYFLLCVYVILPSFNKNTFDLFQIYGPLGGSLSKVAQTCLLHPLKVILYIGEPNKIRFLLQLFAGVAFIPLISILELLPAFLVFMQHLLSSRTGEISLHYHYTAELIPFIFVALIFSISKIIRNCKPWKLALVLLGTALIVHVEQGPIFHPVRGWQYLHSDFSIIQKEKLVREVPKDAAVVTTFEFLSHLSHRQDLYTFHYVYSGFYTISNKRFHLPDNVQYGLIDFNDPLTFSGFFYPSFFLNVLAFLNSGPWGVVDVEDSMVLLKKGVGDRFPLFDFLDKLPAANPLNVMIDNRLKLCAYKLKAGAHRIELALFWTALKHEPKDIKLSMEFLDQNGAIIETQSRPLCYRIWPSYAWRLGEYVQEHQYVTLSPLLKGRVRSIRLRFLEFSSGNPIPTDSIDNSVTIKL